MGPLRRIVAILALSLMAWPFSALWPRTPPPSAQNVARDRAEQIWRALHAFHRDHGRLPTQQEGLDALLKPPHPYLPQLHKDPWGRPFVYHATPRRLFVLSVGPDGTEGTADDIEYFN